MNWYCTSRERLDSYKMRSVLENQHQITLDERFTSRCDSIATYPEAARGSGCIHTMIGACKYLRDTGKYYAEEKDLVPKSF